MRGKVSRKKSHEAEKMNEFKGSPLTVDHLERPVASATWCAAGHGKIAWPGGLASSPPAQPQAFPESTPAPGVGYTGTRTVLIFGNQGCRAVFQWLGAGASRLARASRGRGLRQGCVARPFLPLSGSGSGCQTLPNLLQEKIKRSGSGLSPSTWHQWGQRAAPCAR
jgi:hypothetical protein